MRLATFIQQGKERFGLILRHPATGEDWVFDPATTETRLKYYASYTTSGLYASRPDFSGGAGWPIDLVDFLALEDAGMYRLRRMEDFLRRFLEQSDQYLLLGAGFPVSSVKLRAPIPRPRLLFGLVQNSPTSWRSNPARLHVNLFPQGHQRPQGTVIGPGDPVVVPEAVARGGEFGWNPELGVIIGRRGRDVPIGEALRYVAGLTIVTDMAFSGFRQDFNAQPEPRDWFEDAMSSWGDKKSDTKCPVGPYLVTMDEIGNPYDLMVYTRQSGWMRDRSHTGAMSLGIERTLSWLSSFRTLLPGDVIHMATMGYDGMPVSPVTLATPPGPQDYFESEIEKIGVLRNPLVFSGGSADWRPPEERRIHPSPAVRDLVAADPANPTALIQDPENWQPGAVRHFWMVFGNDQGAEEREGLAPRPYPRFLNAPATALAGPGHTLVLPRRARTLRLGCELACVISQLTSQVTETEAEGCILGYQAMAVLRDSSFAEVVIEPATPQELNIPQVYARWVDGFNLIALPPRRRTAQEVRGLECTLAVEGFGEVRGNTSEYLLTAPQIVAYISRYITLFPGDVIALGRLGNLLTIPADRPIAPGVSGRAAIAGLGEVRFTF